tara:strand:- start:2486 stop:2968 length:483 start_codon:yes stop_codon:yes gene_type:complete
VKPLVDIQNASCEAVPPPEEFRRWVGAALNGRITAQQPEVCIRLVDDGEMAQLNANYRGKDGATNVLSFPADLPAALELPLLGDIVICAPVVIAEAERQRKTTTAHWAHMTVHGTLHLLGYDHVKEEEAEIMEALESAILRQLDYSCPYDSHAPRERIAP